MQILANLPVSARALHIPRRGCGVSVGDGIPANREAGPHGNVNSASGGVGGRHSSNRPSRRLSSDNNAGTVFHSAGGTVGSAGGDACGKWGSGTASADAGGLEAATRTRESLLAAEWMLEPQSQAVCMRDASFSGPLVSCL